MSNSIGRLFTVTSFGESHSICIGAIVDGCPAGLPLTVADIQGEVDRIRPSESAALTGRKEKNRIEIMSGVLEGRTTGAPIGLLIRNEDVDDSVYEKLRFRPRPGHADFTAFIKYGGFNDWRGGGRFTGRITATCVMAGAIARRLLARLGVEIIAHTVEIGGIAASPVAYDKIKAITASDALRCADPAASEKMAALIGRTKEAGDSLGGVVEGIALNVPAGLGEPFFDNLDGDLAKTLFAIPAVKGVELGTGFGAARLKGSENNDLFAVADGKVVTTSNNAGGVLGGISSGMPVTVKVAFKPVASIAAEQSTIDMEKMTGAIIRVAGRHDVCIVPRAVAVVEAMMALTICDFALRAGMIPRILK